MSLSELFICLLVAILVLPGEDWYHLAKKVGGWTRTMKKVVEHITK